MRKLILVAHISLDGFVAGSNGELDGFEADDENLAFVCKLTEEADAALFGRISYELLNNDWPTAKYRPNASKAVIAYSTWYNNAEKIVLSKTMIKKDLNRTTVINNNIVDEITRIRKLPGKDILIFGSPSISQLLMQHDLINDYWIFINPVIFCCGIPLFASSNHKAKLRLLEKKQFSNGEIALHYEQKNSDDVN